MTMNRTPEQIKARIEEEEKWNSFLNFAPADLISWLKDFEDAKPYLNPDVTLEAWGEALKGAVLSPHDEIKAYMPFAWEKANSCRGISASRSIDHLRAWMWLAGEDEFLAKEPLREYTFYGKPQLRLVCEHLGIDWRALDDGKWRASESGHALTAEAALCLA